MASFLEIFIQLRIIDYSLIRKLKHNNEIDSRLPTSMAYTLLYPPYAVVELFTTILALHKVR